MDEVKYPSVCILAPPFYSHFTPLMSLAAALRDRGTEITVGSSPEFKGDVINLGLDFREVHINRNANRGVAVETKQAEEEARRLVEFLDATRLGPVETLITQGRHRISDMFANPEELIESIREIDHEISPSLWIVDQLSYGATLALVGLGLPFMTFCAPHPHSIPTGTMIYSVPPQWPRALKPGKNDLLRLEKSAREVERNFTDKFNAILQGSFNIPGVESAFACTSSRAVICNYPPFPSVRSKGRLFTGHSFTEQTLPDTWKARMQSEAYTVIIAMGTFLSSRDDVIKRLIRGILAARPDARIFAGAGSHAADINEEFGGSVFADRFIPQRALLPAADVIFHHGGVSSFTESLYCRCPMVVLPFSSDQFNVARDVERYGLGAVCDPNALSDTVIADALRTIQSAEVISQLNSWSDTIRSLGPSQIARAIQHVGENNGIP